MAPYRMPLSTDAAARAIKQYQTRHTKGTYGGVPTIVGELLQLVDVLLTDAPMFPSGSQVNLAVVEVDGLAGGQVYPIITYSQPVVINVLDLQTSALDLGTASIPAMKYDGLRFVVDPTQSSVVTGGATYAPSFGVFDSRYAFTPFSAGLANVDFMQPFDATQGPVSMLVDFNVAESVNILPSGGAEIGPRLEAVPWDQSAVVSGTVANAAGSPVTQATVVALNADGSVAASTLTNANGYFEIHALRGSTYSVVVYNSFTAETGVTFSAIGADTTGPVTGPSFTVPDGYRANVGTIAD